MDLPKNAPRYLYMLEAEAFERDPAERDRLSADWSPVERERVALECREKARLYAEEAERLSPATDHLATA
jgi:hypothetical protein